MNTPKLESLCKHVENYVKHSGYGPVRFKAYFDYDRRRYIFSWFTDADNKHRGFRLTEEQLIAGGKGAMKESHTIPDLFDGMTALLGEGVINVLRSMTPMAKFIKACS